MALDSNTCVIAGGFPQTAKEEDVKGFFSSTVYKVQSGGIRKIDERYLIQFVDEQDVEDIMFDDSLEFRTHRSKCKITIEPCPLELEARLFKEQNKTPEQAHGEDCEDNRAVKVYVAGIGGISTDDLYLIFENHKISGGGNIQRLERDDTKDCAYLVFEDVDVAENVIERRTVKHKDTIFEVSRKTKGGKEESTFTQDDTTVVEVRGIGDLSEEDLELVFENRRISGGGEILKLDLDYNNDRAYIQYKDPNVAENVIELRTVKYKETIFEVSRKTKGDKEESTFTQDDTTVVEVRGIGDLSEEDLELVFENRRISGGGEILKLDLDYNNDRAYIQYKDPNVAENVIGKKSVSYKENILEISRKLKYKADEIAFTKDDITVVEVRGIGGLSGEDLQLVFENRRISGGGEILKLDMDSINNCAYIQFKDTNVAENVIGKKSINYKGNTFEVSMKIEGKVEESDITQDDTTVVEVRGIDGLSEDDLELVFENRKISSGGEILKIDLDDNNDCAYIQFKNSKVAENVISKEIVKWKNHSFQTLRKPKPMPVDKTGLLVGNIPADIDKEFFISFLEGKLKNDIEDTIFNHDNTVAVVQFKDKVGKTNVQAILDKKPMKGSVLTVREVRIPCTMKVSGCDDLKKDDLEIYFESRRSNGGSVYRIKMLQSGNEFLVTFESEKVLQRVIEKPVHKIQGKQIIVEVYYNELGPTASSGPINQTEATISKLTVKDKSNTPEAGREKGYLPLDYLTIKILSTKPMEIELVDYLKQNKIDVSFEIQEDGIFITGDDRDMITNAKALFKKFLVSFDLKVSKMSGSHITTQQFRDFINDQMITNACVISVDESKLIINIKAGEKIVSNVSEIIHSHLDNNTIKETIFRCNPYQKKFITRHRSSFLDKLKQEMRDYKIKIIEIDGGLKVSGTRNGPMQVIDKLQQVIKIVACEHEINQPGMAGHFKTHDGRMFLDSVEAKHDCVISTEPSSVTSLSEYNNVADEQASTIAEFKLDDGRMIAIRKENILTCNCQAIVSSANAGLKNKSGLARAIIEKGGSSIVEECAEFIKREGELRTSRNVVTDGGDLKCKVIHAFPPMWRDGSNDEMNSLIDTAYAILQSADEHQCASVAIPALATDSFRFPVKKAASCIADGVIEYFKDNPRCGIRKIVLIDLKRECLDAFNDALISQVECGNVNLLTSSDDLAQSHIANRDDIIMTKEGMKVSIHKAELTSQKVDVIVNSTNVELNLSQGSVAKALLKVGGKSLQDECSRIASKKKIKPGEVIVTGGHGLQCSHVYHCVSLDWNKGKHEAEKNLRKIVQGCLETASSNRFGSIAFPAIGTGNLGYPRECVAKVMLESIKQFSQENRNTTVQDVRLVLYFKDEDTIIEFEKEFKKEQSMSRQSPLNQSGAFYRLLAADKGLAIKIGQLQLKVVEGDICTENTDAILNYVNGDYSFKRGSLGNAIRSRGGKSIEREMASCSVKPNKSFIKTGPGYLPCKNIYHHKDASIDKWPHVIEKFLKCVDSEGLQSVSIPSIGYSKGSVHEIAQSLCEGIGAYAHQNKSKCLKMIRFPVQHDDDLNDFRKVLQDLNGTPFKKSRDRFSLSGFLNIGGWFSSGATADEPVEQIVAPQDQTLSLTLQIYADDVEVFPNVKQDIDNYCKKAIRKECISSPWEDVINNLTNGEEREIESAGKPHVNTKIEKGRRSKLITIYGPETAILQAKDAIFRILRKLKDEHDRKRYGSLISRHVSWVYTDETGDTHEFPEECNAIIEEAFDKKDPSVNFKMDYDDYHLDFSNNIMTTTVYGETYQVKRTQTGTNLPTSWDKMTTKGPLLVKLDDGGQEYHEVLKSFKDTASGKFKSVFQIDRVQNEGLYKRYQVHADHMKGECATGKQVERHLWHGTSSDVVDKINRKGFDRGFHGKNAQVYGNGVYFAKNASYSLDYAFPDQAQQNRRYLYRCLVLVGEFTKGDRGMITPPPKDPQSPSILYDSVVNDPNDPTIFVVFQDAQAYPEYLITLE